MLTHVLACLLGGSGGSGGFVGLTGLVELALGALGVQIAAASPGSLKLDAKLDAR